MWHPCAIPTGVSHTRPSRLALLLLVLVIGLILVEQRARRRAIYR
jgi:hypothetical protein